MALIIDIQVLTKGKLPSLGKIYIGAFDDNPVENPVTVYTDPNYTVSINTPVDLDEDGFPLNDDGDRVNLYTDTSYSKQIRDSYDADIYQVPPRIEVQDVDPDGNSKVDIIQPKGDLPESSVGTPTNFYTWGYFQRLVLGVTPSITDVTHAANVEFVNNRIDTREPSLGNPGVDGYVLSSTAAGVRSWVSKFFSFLGLTDGPSSYAGQAGKAFVVNGAETGVEFADRGDVSGPGSSGDNAIPRYDGITGKIIQNSGVTIDDDNIQNFPGSNAPLQLGEDEQGASKIYFAYSAQIQGTTHGIGLGIADEATYGAKAAFNSAFFDPAQVTDSLNYFTGITQKFSVIAAPVHYATWQYNWDASDSTGSITAILEGWNTDSNFKCEKQTTYEAIFSDTSEPAGATTNGVFFRIENRMNDGAGGFTQMLAQDASSVTKGRIYLTYDGENTTTAECKAGGDGIEVTDVSGVTTTNITGDFVNLNGVDLEETLDEKLSKEADVLEISGTSHTVTDADNGRILAFTNAGSVTLTINAGLDAGSGNSKGFNFTVETRNGTCDISLAGTATRVNFNGHTKVAVGDGATVSFYSTTLDRFTFTGNTA